MSAPPRTRVEAGKTVDAFLDGCAAANPVGPFGHHAECGAACAFRCSRNAGFIFGQNPLLDGGASPGTF